MVSGISSSSTSYLNYLQTQQAKHKPDLADLFSKVDTNGDGKISQSELDAFGKKISQVTGTTLDTTNAISTYDTDSDGGLSTAEFKSFLDANGITPPTSQDSSDSSASTDLFNAITGGSSQMTQAQLDTWAANMSKATGNTIDTTNAISTYDTNGDGTLSATEFSSFLDANGISAPQNAGMAPPPPPPPSGSSEAGSSTTSANSILSKYDTNGDGVLSASELQAYLDDIGSTSSTSSTDSTNSSSLNSLVAKALSAYASSQASSLQNLFQTITGSTDDYTSINYSV